jgi:predicted amidophosphoribosyltransferase
VGCGRCGANLEEGDRFCGHCGVPVDGCPACGAPVIARHRYCRACGAALVEVTPAPSAAAAATFATVIGSLREQSTAYHLAHGLLDHAAHLLRMDKDEAAAVALGQAVGIAERLRCRPLLDRAETIQPARSRTVAS